MSRTPFIAGNWKLNKTIAEVTFANIQRVGMRAWDEKDQAMARAVQKELGVREIGLQQRGVFNIGLPVPESQRTGGGSDDIGVRTTMAALLISAVRFGNSMELVADLGFSAVGCPALPLNFSGSTSTLILGSSKRNVPRSGREINSPSQERSA